MFNDKTCDTCKHFDPIMRGNNKGLRATKWAWCAKHSIYPMYEGPGQTFPEGVQRRTSASELADPKIVKRGEVVASCTGHGPRRSTLSKADLLKKLKEKNKGLLA
jgi:hypothetical protein